MPAPPRTAPTLADVAARAGVHAATVSRVLSRPELVNTATRDRVAAAIDALGYVPNRAARQLAGGRTATLAMLVPDIANPFFAVVIQAAQRHAAEHDHLLVLADTEHRASSELAAATHLAPHVDGFVVCSSVARATDLLAATADRPCVLVNRRATGLASIVVDQAAVVDEAVAHLTALGHRRIALGRGPAAYWSSGQRERRARHHAELVPVGPVDPTFDGGSALLDATLDARASAVIAFNDMQAVGVLAAAVDRGMSVPTDLSVVGSDGIELSSMVTPKLTTVAAPLDALAASAVDALLAQLNGAPPTSAQLSPQLRVGGTTGPARPGARSR